MNTPLHLRPRTDYDLHLLAGIGYHLAIGLDLDRFDARIPDLFPAWYVVDVPPVAGPHAPADVHWFADQADAFVYAVNRLLAENEAETGDPEPRLSVDREQADATLETIAEAHAAEATS